MRTLNSATPILVAITLTVIILSAPPAYPQAQNNIAEHRTSDPARSRAQYQAVASQLDTGGDLLVVANMEGVIEDFIGNVIRAVSLAETADPNRKKFKTIVTKLSSFLQKNGFYAINGFGMSVVPRADGLNTVKTFVSRDASAADLPLWRGLVGTGRRRLAGLAFLPSDTVMARVMSGDLKQVWKLVRSGVREVANPGTITAFDKSVDKLAVKLGVEVDTLIGSLGNEGFFSIQFSRDTTMTLPSQGEPLSMPTPSLLIGIAVNDDTLANVVEDRLTDVGTAMNMPLIKAQMGDTLIQTLNLPLPFLPFTIQPTFATHSGTFLFGSNPDVVKKAITASRDRNGLAATPEFKKAFQGLTMVNNGVMYMSPRFMEVITDIQSMALSAGGAGRRRNAGVIKALNSLMNKEGPQSAAFVVLNGNSGVLTTGTSSSSGKEVVASTFMMPIGMIAGIAIPSFTKARNTSQRNACINNLRMIDAAKEQWALANNKIDGATVEEQGIKEYLRGNRLPVCPKGGTYTIDAIGFVPKCSMPRHKLKR